MNNLSSWKHEVKYNTETMTTKILKYVFFSMYTILSAFEGLTFFLCVKRGKEELS